MTAAELLEQLNNWDIQDPTSEEMEWITDRLEHDGHDDNLGIYLRSVKAGRSSNNLAKKYEENNDYLNPIIGAVDREKTSLDNETSVLNGLVNTFSIPALGGAALINPLGTLGAVIGGMAASEVGDDLVSRVSEYDSMSQLLQDKLGVSRFTSEFLNPFILLGGSIGAKAGSVWGSKFTSKYAGTIAKLKNFVKPQQSSAIMGAFPKEIGELVEARTGGMTWVQKARWAKTAEKALRGESDPEVARGIIDLTYKEFTANSPVNPYNADAVLASRANRLGITPEELMQQMEDRRFKGTELDLLEILIREKESGLDPETSKKSLYQLELEAKQAMMAPNAVSTKTDGNFIIIDKNQPSFNFVETPPSVSREDVYINQFLHEFSHIMQSDLNLRTAEFTTDLLKECGVESLEEIFYSPSELTEILLKNGEFPKVIEILTGKKSTASPVTYSDPVYGSYLQNAESGLTEDIARIGQLKDWLGLTKDLNMTKAMFEKAKKHYIEQTGSNNTMKEFLLQIKDVDKFLRLANSKGVKRIIGMVAAGLTLTDLYDGQTE